MTSAESRLAASSKEIRVRVESSKNRLTTVRPRRVGSLRTSRPAMACSSRSAVDSTCSAVARFRSPADSRCRGRWIGAAARRCGRCRGRDRRLAGRRCRSHGCRHDAPWRGVAGGGYRAGQFDAVHAVDLDQVHGDVVTEGRRDVLADVVGADRQLPVTPIDQDGQLDDGRSAVIAQRVERGADRPPGVQDVVDQDHDGVIDAANGQSGFLQRTRWMPAQVVPVQRDVQRSDGGGSTGERGQPLGEPAGQVDPPGGNAEQDDRAITVAFQDLVRDPVDGPGDVGPAENFGEDLGLHRPSWRRRAADELDRGCRSGYPRRAGLSGAWVRQLETSFPASLDGP